MTREEISKNSIELSKHNKILALEFATGVGKSKVALEIISHFFKDNIEILLVVAELAHFDNWKNEITKWGYDKLLNNIVIVTYASLKKHVYSKYDIIILDEAHHIGSELRLDIIDKIKFDKMLLLSATMNTSLKITLSLLFGTNIETYKITLQDAIDWNLLAQPKIFLIPLYLDNKHENEIVVEEWGQSKLRVTHNCKFSMRWEYLKQKKIKYPNVTLNIKCTQYQKYLYITGKYDYYKKTFMRTRNEGFKNKWLQLGLQRKKFLGELKTQIVKKFLSTLKEHRYVCFCSSIDQANELNNDTSIHSKKDNSLQIIDDFNDKKINNLYAVNMLQEGQNLTDIEAGIIIQLDGQERSFIQKFGRSLRAEDPNQYIFYYKNTRDEEYLVNALEGINKDYITEIELNYANKD